MARKVLRNARIEPIDGFVAIGNELAIVRYCIENGVPLSLRGPTGCGKSLCVAQVADEAGKSLETVSGVPGMPRSSTIGAMQLKGDSTVFVPGPLIEAVRSENTVFYFDEVRFAPPEAITMFHSLLDHRRELYISETRETIRAAKGFSFVASYNPGNEYGRGIISPALRQRCILVDFNYLPAPLEVKVVLREGKGKRRDAEKLVKVAWFLREKCAGILPVPPSTRLLILASKLVAAGVCDPEETIVAQIVNNLSDDIAARLSAVNALRVEGLLKGSNLDALVHSNARISDNGAAADEFFNKE